MKKSEPSINVFNRQRAFAVDLLSLRQYLERLSARLSVPAAFSVVLVRDKAMRRYNKQFRGKDSPTDVLAFPVEADVESEPYLGDIVISVESADRQKIRDLADELKVLSLHGLLHLLGYDHETDAGAMRRLETKIKKEFQLR